MTDAQLTVGPRLHPEPDECTSGQGDHGERDGDESVVVELLLRNPTQDPSVASVAQHELCLGHAFEPGQLLERNVELECTVRPSHVHRDDREMPGDDG